MNCLKWDGEKNYGFNENQINDGDEMNVDEWMCKTTSKGSVYLAGEVACDLNVTNAWCGCG